QEDGQSQQRRRHRRLRSERGLGNGFEGVTRIIRKLARRAALVRTSAMSAAKQVAGKFFNGLVSLGLPGPLPLCPRQCRLAPRPSCTSVRPLQHSAQHLRLARRLGQGRIALPCFLVLPPSCTTRRLSDGFGVCRSRNSSSEPPRSWHQGRHRLRPADTKSRPPPDLLAGRLFLVHKRPPSHILRQGVSWPQPSSTIPRL